MRQSQQLSLLLTIVLLPFLFETRVFAEDKLPWSGLPVPDLGVRMEDLAPVYAPQHFVWIRESKIPGCLLDLFCYEHSQVTLVETRKRPNGAFELRHRSNQDAHVLLITHVTPEPGAVELVIHAEVDKSVAAAGKLPRELPSPNLCFRVKRSEDCFASFPFGFPDFIGRCFIFTESGQKFLLDTKRFPLPRAAKDDPRNNPPYVQQYFPVWQPLPDESQGQTWYNRSTDRFIVPVMGVVSRDKKSLTAIANDTSDLMTQAWQECLHNNPKWSPATAPPEEQRWRVKIYIMPNDPKLLLERVAHDFPAAMKLREKAVPVKK